MNQNQAEWKGKNGSELFASYINIMVEVGNVLNDVLSICFFQITSG